MDSQFNTLSRSYHDNYIEYATTGKKAYKSAYEKAEEGLKSVIDSLKKQIHENTTNIKDTLGSNAKSLLVEKQNGLNNIGRGIHQQKDRVVEAQMRLPPTPPPFSHQTQYTVLGALVVAIALLQVF